jgi:16S rRNA (guanine527-N7)-methyltransferase
MIFRELAELCAANQLRLSDETQMQLEAYANYLRSWNGKINLISRKDEENIVSRHILHALTLRMPQLSGYDFISRRVADVGTGGGLPGIPLKIVTPSLHITLIDSIQKKIAACKDIIERLGLTGISAIAGRAEELAKVLEHARAYDAIVSRAVAPLDELVNWTRGLVKPGGTLFSLKGGDLTEEIERSRRFACVREIHELPLAIVEYDDFVKEGKKLIRVDFV